MEIIIDLMETWAIFVVWLLINLLVNVAEAFIDILKYITHLTVKQA